MSHGPAHRSNVQRSHVKTAHKKAPTKPVRSSQQRRSIHTLRLQANVKHPKTKQNIAQHILHAKKSFSTLKNTSTHFLTLSNDKNIHKIPLQRFSQAPQGDIPLNFFRSKHLKELVDDDQPQTEFDVDAHHDDFIAGLSSKIIPSEYDNILDKRAEYFGFDLADVKKARQTQRKKAREVALQDYKKAQEYANSPDVPEELQNQSVYDYFEGSRTSDDSDYQPVLNRHTIENTSINPLLETTNKLFKYKKRTPEEIAELKAMGAICNSDGDISEGEEFFLRSTELGRIPKKVIEQTTDPLAPPPLENFEEERDAYLRKQGIDDSPLLSDDFDIDAFESFGELGQVIANPKTADEFVKRFGVNKHGRIKGKANVPFSFPKLKPGAPIPKGWMVTQEGFCVPKGKEFIHHKYADPELYHGREDDNLLNQVNEKLHPRLKIATQEEAEAFHEYANTGLHMSLNRHTDRVLHNPVIDKVIANIKNTRYKREVNHDLTFEYKNISAMKKKYQVTMRGTSHAYLDIDPAKTKVNIKTRPQHSVPGPSMDYSFM